MRPKWWLAIKELLDFCFTAITVRHYCTVMVPFFLCIYSHTLRAQKEDYNWVMNNQPLSVIIFSNYSVYVDTLLNTALPPVTPTIMNWTSSSISDNAGRLLFFTNGYKVYNRLGQQMPNGTGLNPSQHLQDWGNVYNVMLQAALILPMPGSERYYYIFHSGVSDSCPPPAVYAQNVCTLFYSIVDMQAHNGLGDVVSKNNVLLTGPEFAAGQLMACRHANGRDWWVVKNGFLEPRYYKFLFTSQGIEPPLVQDIGRQMGGGQFGGTSVFSPDGTKFATGGIYSGKLFSKLVYMDFNRCTGEFSNADTLSVLSTYYSEQDNDSVWLCPGSAFSPNGRYLYAHSCSDLYQYDLCSSNPQASQVLLHTAPKIPGTTYSARHFFPMQLAPNGRIYLGPYNLLPYLSVIEQPDSSGLNCSFKPYSIELPKYQASNSGRGMPNFPNFRLGASPVYQMQAGANRTICKDSTTQLGSAQKANELIYNWRSTDPNAYISDVHSHQPTISTTADEALFIVDVVDTVSRLTCLERSDTVVVKTYTCYPNQLNIPTIIKSGNNPYLVIPNLPANTAVQVYNAAGQLMFESNSYQNQWHAANVAAGIYAIRTRMSNGTEQRGKVVVVD